ncbi:MAG TPA: hypothetical protein VFS39_02135 [Nitrospira sp.]|nr:hypothetical protein [Nitrospira sp.]
MKGQPNNISSGDAMKYIASCAMSALAIILFGTVSWAGDQKLGSLLAHPESYSLKTVRVTGIVSDHELKHVKQWANNVDRCVQTFVVKDETGSMRATYGANCSGAMDLIRNRDRVTIEARFEWAPGKAALLNVQTVVGKMAPYP